MEQNKAIKNKEKSDAQIKNLSNEITTLKQTKVKLVRNMRSETDKFNKWKRSREQELFKLKDQDRKRLNQITRLQAEHGRQKNVFKRKLEESQAIHKRLKVNQIFSIIHLCIHVGYLFVSPFWIRMR